MNRRPSQTRWPSGWFAEIRREITRNRNPRTSVGKTQGCEVGSDLATMRDSPASQISVDRAACTERESGETTCTRRHIAAQGAMEPPSGMGPELDPSLSRGA